MSAWWFFSWFSMVFWCESAERKRAERLALEDEARGEGQALRIPGCPSYLLQRFCCVLLWYLRPKEHGGPMPILFSGWTWGTIWILQTRAVSINIGGVCFDVIKPAQLQEATWILHPHLSLQTWRQSYLCPTMVMQLVPFVMRDHPEQVKTARVNDWELSAKHRTEHKSANINKHVEHFLHTRWRRRRLGGVKLPRFLAWQFEWGWQHWWRRLYASRDTFPWGRSNQKTFKPAIWSVCVWCVWVIVGFNVTTCAQPQMVLNDSYKCRS